MRKSVHSLLLVLIFLCFFAAPAFAASFSAIFLNGTTIRVPNDCSGANALQIAITTIHGGWWPDEWVIDSSISVGATIAPVSGVGYTENLYTDVRGKMVYLYGEYDFGLAWPPAGDYNLYLKVFSSVLVRQPAFNGNPAVEFTDETYCGEQTFTIRIESDELEILSVAANPNTLNVEEAAAGSEISFHAVTTQETEVLFTVISPSGEEYVLGYMPTTQQGSTHVADISWRDHPTLLPGKYTVIAEAMGETDIIRKSGTFDVSSGIKVTSVAAEPNVLDA
ncbi:MAG: hypothetical protein PHV05_07190, partial [Candidatus Riflebacteria bacterium]|nr:hypothetical protein [Candidatus Riflebacteria bacterium]